MRLFRFLKSRSFVINLLLSGFLIVGLVYGALRFIDYYTLHGLSVTVPDLKGLEVSEVEEILNNKELRFTVVDSFFNQEEPRGIVLEQDPKPEALVKKNRIIYLTTNAMFPPRIPMPRLTERTLRQATIILQNLDLKLGENLVYKPDQCVGCVITQEINGQPIEEGTLVEKGTIVNLVIGMGLGAEQEKVPLLINLTLEEAIKVLQSKYLNLGAEIYDETVLNLEDSALAKVYSQYPEFSDESFLPMGSSVDLRLTRDSTIIDTTLYVKDSVITSDIDYNE